MTKNTNIRYLKKLSARQLEEFCAYVEFRACS